MNRLLIICTLFWICQACGTTSETFDNSSARAFAGIGSDSVSGITSSQSSYTIKINPGIPGYTDVKNGIKVVLKGAVPSGVFTFVNGSGPTSGSGITIASGTGVPADVYNAITRYLQQSGYAVELRKNQSSLGKTVSIW
jgi:hypothetical protein